MSTKSPLKELSTSEKLQLMEELWADLTGTPSEYEVPEWHGDILDKRAKLFEEGKLSYKDWQTAKKEINKRVQK